MAIRDNTPSARSRGTTRFAETVTRWRSGVLVTGGLGCLVTAAWVLHLVAGLAVLGLALLVLDLITRRDDS